MKEIQKQNDINNNNNLPTFKKLDFEKKENNNINENNNKMNLIDINLYNLSERNF